MTNLIALKVANEKHWAQAHITPSRVNEVMKVAHRLVEPSAKARYQAIEQATTVPWFVIAVIHEREASQRWDRQLGQGDPLNHVSIHRPKGRGPFFGPDAFHRAAIDALVNCPPHAARWTDWSAGGSLTLLTLYNGTGYEDYHHMPSPYDWGATDQQQRGKYVGDNKFDPSVWDTQLGCAAMLKGMMALDLTIAFPGAPLPTPRPPIPPS